MVEPRMIAGLSCSLEVISHYRSKLFEFELAECLRVIQICVTIDNSRIVASQTSSADGAMCIFMYFQLFSQVFILGDTLYTVSCLF